MSDHLLEAQLAAEKHLETCDEALCEDLDDPEEWPESPAMAPYCGCQRCQVRETLFAALPHIKAAIEAGQA